MKKGLLFILLAAASVCLPAQEKENAAKSYTFDMLPNNLRLL